MFGEPATKKRKLTMKSSNDELNPQLHWQYPASAGSTHKLLDRTSHELGMLNPGLKTGQIAINEAAWKLNQTSGLLKKEFQRMDLPRSEATERSRCDLQADERLLSEVAALEEKVQYFGECSSFWPDNSKERLEFSSRKAAANVELSAARVRAAKVVSCLACLPEGSIRTCLSMCYDGGISPGIQESIGNDERFSDLFVQLLPLFHSRALDVRTHNKIPVHLGFRDFVVIHMGCDSDAALRKMIEVINPVHKPWACFRVWWEGCVLDILMVYMLATDLLVPAAGAEGDEEKWNVAAFEEWVEQHCPEQYEGWRFYMDWILDVSFNNYMIAQFAGRALVLVQ